MANIETKLRLNRVVFKDSHEADVVAIVTTNKELTIDELQIIARYGSEFIRNDENYKEMIQKIRDSLKNMRHSSVAIKYGCLLNKLEGFSYCEVK